MLLEAVKNNSPRINIKLVEHKYGLVRMHGATGTKELTNSCTFFFNRTDQKDG